MRTMKDDIKTAGIVYIIAIGIALILNVALLAGGVWLVVTLLRWMDVL